MRTHVPIRFLAAIGIALFSQTDDTRANDSSLEEIADIVRSNEQLYENIDVTMEMVYEAELDDDQGAMPLPSGQKVVPYKSYRDRISHVRQDGMFRLVFDRDVVMLNTDKKESEELQRYVEDTYARTRSYDGDKTRLLNNNAFGNIIYGKDEKDGTRIIPHALLLRMSLYKTYLSTLLGGQLALETANEFDLGTKRITCEYIGQDVIEGEQSAIVHVKVSLKGDRHIVWKLCLAIEKNYIPHLVECRQSKVSDHLPTSAARVTEWKEVLPGVWFPMKSEIRAYDKEVLRERNRQQQRWSLVMTTESISFNPNYDQAHFSDVVFPEGLMMYVIDNDRVGPEGDGNQIVKSYVKGSPSDPAVAEIAAANKFWTGAKVMAFNAFVAALVVAVFRIVRKRRPKHSH